MVWYGLVCSSRVMEGQAPLYKQQPGVWMGIQLLAGVDGKRPSDGVCTAAMRAALVSTESHSPVSNPRPIGRPQTTRGRCHKRPRPLQPRQLHSSCFWTKRSGSQQTPARLAPGSRGSVPAQTRWITGSRRPPPPGETFNSLHWFKQHYCVTDKYFKKGSILCLRKKENANASHSNGIWLFWEILWTIHEVNHVLMNWCLTIKWIDNHRKTVWCINAVIITILVVTFFLSL